MDNARIITTGDAYMGVSKILWVLSLMIVSAIPLFFHIPPWISTLYTTMILWRGYSTMVNKPRLEPWIISTVALISTSVAFFTLMHELNPIYAIAILMLLLGCKSLLAITPSSWTNIIILLPIMPMAVFLQQNPSWGIGYIIAYSWFWVMTLIMMWQSGSPVKYAFIKSFKLLILVMPFIVTSFIFMPRPKHWIDMMEQKTAGTGLSKKVKPGEISKISDSKGLAFVANIKETIHPEDLYWRAYVMQDYNGEQWSLAENQPMASTAVKRSKSKPIRYMISNFGALDTPVLLEQTFAVSTSNIVLTQYGTGISDTDHIVYSAYADTGASLIAPPMASDVRLPSEQVHVKTDRLVAELKKESRSEQEFLDNLRLWMSKRNFVYSKEPGEMKKNWIDTFLFERKKGFCEHYASTVAYMMRRAGYPARLAVGFQGAEHIKKLNEYRVPQAAAHAWMEYWDSSNKNWVRLDPTGWVAPERLSDAGWEIIENRDRLRAMEESWFGRAAEYFNNFESAWQKWVVNYDADKQTQVLKTLDKLPWFKILIVVVGVAILIGIFIYFKLRKKWSEAEYIKQKLRKAYSGTNMEWCTYNTPREWIIKLKYAGVDSNVCDSWLNSFESTLYADVPEVSLKYLTRELRRSIKNKK